MITLVFDEYSKHILTPSQDIDYHNQHIKKGEEQLSQQCRQKYNFLCHLTRQSLVDVFLLYLSFQHVHGILYVLNTRIFQVEWIAQRTQYTFFGCCLNRGQERAMTTAALNFLSTKQLHQV
jgi:hypothetical protein